MNLEISITIRQTWFFELLLNSKLKKFYHYFEQKFTMNVLKYPISILFNF
jgi:hypothetical protein